MTAFENMRFKLAEKLCHKKGILNDAYNNGVMDGAYTIALMVSICVTEEDFVELVEAAHNLAECGNLPEYKELALRTFEEVEKVRKGSNQ